MDFPLNDLSQLEQVRLCGDVRTGLAFGNCNMDLETSSYLAQILAGEKTVDEVCDQIFEKYAVVCGEVLADTYSDFDSYSYPGMATLRNKLSIRSNILLNHIEGKFTAVRMLGLLANPVPEDFSVEYFRSIHEYLFRDLYAWAGSFRKCPMSRTQTYAVPGFIGPDMSSFCDWFRENFLETDFLKKLDMADMLAKSWGRLNKVHAFRDGNGRTQYVFFRMACMTKGYDLWAMDSDMNKLRTARDLASLGREGILREVLFRSLHPLDGDVPQHEKVRPFAFPEFGPDGSEHQVEP